MNSLRRARTGAVTALATLMSLLALLVPAAPATAAPAYEPFLTWIPGSSSQGNLAIGEGRISFRTDRTSFVISQLAISDKACDGYGIQMYFQMRLSNGDDVRTRTFANNTGCGTTAYVGTQTFSKSLRIRSVVPYTCLTLERQLYRCTRHPTSFANPYY